MLSNENNDFAVDRKKLEEEYEDSFWRLIMYGYAEQEGEEYLKELKEIKDDPQYEPSPELNRRIYREIDKYFRRQKFQRVMSNSRKILNKVAMFVLAASTVFVIAYTSVGAFRLQVLNLLLKFENEYTSVKLGEDDENSIANLKNSYAPSYIPEGYDIDKVTDLESVKITEYVNNDEKIIYFSVHDSSAVINIDTENADVKKSIKINGEDGLFVQKGEKTTITWAHDNKIFIIISKLEEAEIIKMAENIKLIK